MPKSTSLRKKSFTPYAIATMAIGAVGAIGALFAGVSPAMAADLAQQVDTQVAVFMMPVAVLFLAILFEVTRMAWRGALPADAPARPLPNRHWAKTRSGD